MKKVLIALMLFISVTACTQSRLRRGMVVGNPPANMSLIDSIKTVGDYIVFYSGATDYYMKNSATISTGDISGTAWRVFYTDGSGNMFELALGASGTYLGSNGASSAPTFSTPSGSGDVLKVGNPVNNQVGVWTGNGTIEGTSALSFNGTALDITGNITLSGTVDGVDIATDVPANTAKVTNATHTGDVTGSGTLTITANAVDDTHIDWGLSANQVSAVDVPIADGGGIITGTEVETALQENRAAINLNTAKQTNATHTGAVTGSSALAIASNVIEAANLESTNSPTDNYIPSYDLASSGFTWILPSSGDVVSTNNLNDLGDTAVARTNMNVYAKHEVEAIAGDSAQAIITEGLPGPLLSDTAVVFTIPLGWGNPADTAIFGFENVVWGTKWNGSYTLNMTQVTGVVHGTSPDIDVALYSDANFRDATPSDTMLNANLSITSTTTGNATTSFADATVDPGEWLWISVEDTAAKPTQCILTIDGFRSLYDGALYTPEAQALFNEWTILPGPDTLAEFNILIDSMVTSGFWDRTDIAYWQAGRTEFNSVINIIDPSAGTYDLTNVNNTTWAQWDGFTGNATDSHLEANFNMEADGVNYQLNSGSVSIYLGIDQQESRMAFGAREDGDSAVNLTVRNTSDRAEGTINGGSFNIASTDSDGLRTLSRTSSTLTTVMANGVSLGTDSDASLGVPNAEMHILSRSAAPSHSTNRVIFFIIMDGITVAEHTRLFNWVERLADYIGAGTQ